MKVLVTGVGGFIGGNLSESLREDHDVAAPTRSELDLLDDDAVRRYLGRRRFDAVVHAASGRANRRIGAPDDLLRCNCRMFFNLARNRDLFGKLLFLSSGAVYDKRQPLVRVAEEAFDQKVPADDYGFAKYICASYVAEVPNQYELRLFGVFGPHEDWQVRFISNACCRAVWDLPIIIRQNAPFDYLDVADLGKIVNWFITARPARSSYNVCAGRTLDLLTLARKVVCASGKRLDICVNKEGLGPEYSGDNARLLKEMPEFPFRAIDDSIAALYRWYLDRRQTIDPAALSFDA